MWQRANRPLAIPRNIFWIGLTIISATLFVAAVQVGFSIRDLQLQVAYFEQIARNGNGLGPAQLQSRLASVRSDMAVIRSDAGWLLPILPAFGWLPQTGGDLSEAGDIFYMADALVSAADAAVSGWSPQPDPQSALPSGAALDNLTRSLLESRPAFSLAKAYLARAAYYRARINTETLSERTASVVDRAERAALLLQLAVDASLALPDLLGATEPRNYLIVAQNEDERRATGGFVSAAGLMTVDHGRVTALDFMDSYQVDDPEADFPQPPEPIQTYMLGGYWLFRDANWSPDFPTAARQLAAFYELGKHQHVDGVIAVDQEMVRLLVQAVGSVELSGNPATVVTADNLLKYMRESWAPPPNVPVGDAWLARKNFIGELAKALLERITAGDGLDGAALARAVYDAQRGRHLLVYVVDSPLAPALSRAGWDGALQTPAGDFAMVVDSNLGFNKANSLVAQEFDYAVSIASDRSAQSALQISYQHMGTPSDQLCMQKVPDYGPSTTYDMLMNLCLWDYLRLYVPMGSSLVDATHFPIPARQMLNRMDSTGEPQVTEPEGGKDTFAAFFVVAQGERKVFQFRYNLPPGTIQRTSDGAWSYALYWQKQPGTPVMPVRFALTLPPRAVVQRSTGPAAPLVTGNNETGLQLAYSFDLAGDTTLQVIFR